MRADVDIADTLCHLRTVVASAGHLQFSMYAGIQSAAVFGGIRCGREKCPKMIRPHVVNEKTIELLTVILQANLYLSVVRISFDILIFCQ